MNKYLVKIFHWFGSPKQFVIEGENKQDALDRARIYVESYEFDDYNRNSVKVIKKLQNK